MNQILNPPALPDEALPDEESVKAPEPGGHGVRSVLRYLFVRRITRIRGNGWTICPHCHESALQEVHDNITCLSIGFYRLFPWGLRRTLVCLNCRHRRPTQPFPVLPKWPATVATAGLAAMALWDFILCIAAARQGNPFLAFFALACGALTAAVATRMRERTVLVFALGTMASLWSALIATLDLALFHVWGTASAIQLLIGAATAAITVWVLWSTPRMRIPPPTELEQLRTGSGRIKPSFMTPLGAGSVFALAAVSILAFGGAASAVVAGISFSPMSGGTFIPATFDVPRDWNSEFDDKPGDAKPYRLVLNQIGDGNLQINLARPEGVHTLGDIISNYFTFTDSVNSEEFPSYPPPAQCTTIGGVPAAYIVLNYLTQGETAVTYFYAFIHQGTGYFFTFQGTNTPDMNTDSVVKQIAAHVTGSLRFTGGQEARTHGSAAASPSSAPAATPSATASPGAPTPSGYTADCG